MALLKQKACLKGAAVMNTIEFKKLNRMPYITRRMYIIKNVCELEEIDLEYLFGLFDLYNKRNSGRWFWQKATFTGALKESYDNFNAEIDRIVKDLKKEDEEKTKEQIRAASAVLNGLLVNMETNCNVDRKKDSDMVKGNLGKNFKQLIDDSLYRKFR